MEINLDTLRKNPLMIATPMYGGMACGSYATSLMSLSAFCAEKGLPLTFRSIFNESLISRARNYCIDGFMNSEDCTHFLFIDSDISFKVLDVISLWYLSCNPEYENDIICGPYPKKNISWEKIVDAVDNGRADENPNNLENYTGDYVFSAVKGGEYRLDEVVEVSEAGTGFMMIPKTALLKFREKYPEYMYYPDHIRSQDFDGSRQICAFFQDPIENGRHLSEDYFFCHRLRDIGGRVFICPWMKLDHIGTYIFKGDLSAIASIGAHTSADKSKIKY